MIVALRSAPSGSQVRPAPRVAREQWEPLIDGVLRGDPGATRELCVLLTPSLLRVARGVLGPWHPDLEDVVQDALVRVIGALPNFRRESGLVHFAARIAVRATADFARKRRNQPFAELDVERVENMQEGTPMVTWRRQQLLLHLLLEELSENQSETLILRSVLGYRIEEIAETTGVPANTVRSRLRLAKEALRRRIETDPAFRELTPEARS